MCSHFLSFAGWPSATQSSLIRSATRTIFGKQPKKTPFESGTESLEIAKVIRKKYQLEARHLVFDEWNIDGYFKDELVKIEERKSKREKAQREIIQPE